MDYKVLEIHAEFKNDKLKRLAVVWESNDNGSVRGTYCEDKPRAGYEFIMPNDLISPKLIQKVAGYGMNLPDNYKHLYFPAITNWER